MNAASYTHQDVYKRQGMEEKKRMKPGMNNKERSFFFSSRRRHTRSFGDWSSDVCSSDRRHGTPLASRDVPGERGRLSRCIWNLGIFPNDARKNCPFVWTSFTGWSSERCPGIGFLSRGDREIGVLRNVEPPTRPRLECLRETGLILRCDRKVRNPFQTKQGSRPSCPDQEGTKGSEEGVPENLSVPREGDRDFGDLCGSHQGCQVPFRPPIPNVGLLLRLCSGKGLHLAMTGEPRGFSRVAAGFSSYDGEFRMPLVLAQGSPIFHSSCEGKLGIALE